MRKKKAFSGGMRKNSIMNNSEVDGGWYMVYVVEHLGNRNKYIIILNISLQVNQNYMYITKLSISLQFEAKILHLWKNAKATNYIFFFFFHFILVVCLHV